MPRGQAQGYVYFIKDPRLTLKGEKDIVFVGNGRYPWESVARHLERSSNPEVADWAEELHHDFPEGVEILGRIVAARWHGDVKQEIPPVPLGYTRVEWGILDLEDEEPTRDNHQEGLSDGNRVILGGSKKSYWIRHLREEGQPLMNRDVGRPRTRRPSKLVVTP